MVDYVDILSKDFDKNFRKNCKPLQQRCHICNSPIVNEETAKMLRMTFDGELSEVETDEETSQGWFIVGSNCYQKYKKMTNTKKMIILAIFTHFIFSEPFVKIGKFKPIFDNRQKFEIIRK